MKQNSLVILFAFCVILSSCVEDKRAYTETSSVEPAITLGKEKGEIDTQKTDSLIEQNETSGKEKGKTDSLRTDTTKTVAKDTVKIEAVIPAKTAAKESELPNFWEVLVLGISGLAFVLCIIILYRIRRLGKDVSYELRDVEENSRNRLHSYKNTIAERLGEIEQNCSKLKNNMDSLSARITSLESTGMPTKSINHEKERKTEAPKNDKEQETKRGYFGIVKVGGGIAMFNDYPKTRNDGAYFEVEYLDDNLCEFAPIELDRIRSIDAVNEAVEYNGDIAYAKSMEVTKKGKAVFDKGHGFWKITDKADIKLKN